MISCRRPSQKYAEVLRRALIGERLDRDRVLAGERRAIDGRPGTVAPRSLKTGA